jgi:amino acid transporter
MAASRLADWLEGYRWRAGLEPVRRERPVITGLGLFCISFGSIIGTGWGFAALGAAEIAGSAALLSWVVVLTVVVVFAMVHAELGSMFFVSGGTTCFPLPAFGGLVSTLTWWLYFMNGVPTVGIEVSAVLAFATHYVPQLTTAGKDPALTGVGLGVALLLIAVLLIVNVIGVGFLARLNGGLVLAKLVLLGGSMFVLLSSSGHLENLTSGGGFVMSAPDILKAGAASGVMFALLGSEQAVQFGAETAPGSRGRLPSAVIWSLVAAFVLYAFLQIAFTATVNPDWVKGGWKDIRSHFPDPLVVPFGALAQQSGLGWLADVILVVMLLSPLGTAGLYLATAGRTTLAMARIRNLRPLMLMTESGIPVLAMLLAFGVACCLLLPFPGWQALVSFSTKATLAGYGFQTLALGALRRQLPDLRRPYRLPRAGLLAPLGFVFANEMIMFGGWEDNLKLGIAIVLGVVLALALGLLRSAPPLDLSGAAWVVPYLFGVGAVSYLSRESGARGTLALGLLPGAPPLNLSGAVWVIPYLFGVGTPPKLTSIALGGGHILPFGVDVLAMAAVSLGIYALAMWTRLSPERGSAYARQLGAPAEEPVLPPAGEGQEPAAAATA